MAVESHPEYDVPPVGGWGYGGRFWGYTSAAMPPAKIVLGTLPQIEEALAHAIELAKAGDPLAPVTVLVDNSLLKQQLPRTSAMLGQAHLNVRYFRPDELARHLEAQRNDAEPSPRLTRDAERFLVRDIAGIKGVAGVEGHYFAVIVKSTVPFPPATLTLPSWVPPLACQASTS